MERREKPTRSSRDEQVVSTATFSKRKNARDFSEEIDEKGGGEGVAVSSASFGKEQLHDRIVKA